MLQNYAKFDFFQYSVFCRKYFPWMLELKKNSYYTNLYTKTLYNNANFISLRKIFDTLDTFGRGGHISDQSKYTIRLL